MADAQVTVEFAGAIASLIASTESLNRSVRQQSVHYEKLATAINKTGTVGTATHERMARSAGSYTKSLRAGTYALQEQNTAIQRLSRAGADAHQKLARFQASAAAAATQFAKSKAMPQIPLERGQFVLTSETAAIRDQQAALQELGKMQGAVVVPSTIAATKAAQKHAMSLVDIGRRALLLVGIYHSVKAAVVGTFAAMEKQATLLSENAKAVVNLAGAYQGLLRNMSTLTSAQQQGVFASVTASSARTGIAPSQMAAMYSGALGASGALNPAMAARAAEISSRVAADVPTAGPGFAAGLLDLVKAAPELAENLDAALGVFQTISTQHRSITSVEDATQIIGAIVAASQPGTGTSWQQSAAGVSAFSQVMTDPSGRRSGQAMVDIVNSLGRFMKENFGKRDPGTLEGRSALLASKPRILAEFLDVMNVQGKARPIVEEFFTNSDSAIRKYYDAYLEQFNVSAETFAQRGVDYLRAREEVPGEPIAVAQRAQAAALERFQFKPEQQRASMLATGIAGYESTLQQVAATEGHVLDQWSADFKGWMERAAKSRESPIQRLQGLIDLVDPDKVIPATRAMGVYGRTYGYGAEIPATTQGGGLNESTVALMREQRDILKDLLVAMLKNVREEESATVREKNYRPFFGKPALVDTTADR